MREADYPEFASMLDAVCNLLSRGAYAPDSINTALWFRCLEAHDLAAVRAGFDAHVKDPQRGRFVPTPADILAQIVGDMEDDGRPGAEEAWAIALKAPDEAATIVWTQEIAQAWGVCKPVHDVGDKVGARMAFKEAYVRLVDAAREARQPVRWDASIGHDPAQRDDAIRRAQAAGLLPPPPPPVMIEGPACSAVSPIDGQSVREKLAAMSARLKAKISAAQEGSDESAVIGRFKQIPPEARPPGMRGDA